MNPTFTVTLPLLVSLKACREQRDIFAEAYPDGVTITSENIPTLAARMVELNLDVAWAAECLLTPRQRKAYQETIAPAWKVYQETAAAAWKVYQETAAAARKVYPETIAPARKVYQETIAAAEKAYQETRAPAWKAYQETIAPARKVYPETIAPARKVYQETIASAFLRALLSDRE